MSEDNEVYEGEVVTGQLVVAGAEIDQQVATAHRYPRSIKQFRTDVLDMVTLSEEIASECIFAVPRGKENGKQKFIEGASVRFAEIAVSAYGNARCGSRPIAEEKDYVVAQGFFHDLEKNVAITVEVRRSIMGKFNKRFNSDMIGVTTNAACSIARRNAILQGVPKALWKDLYDTAKKTAIGDAKTLVSKRSDMMLYFQKMNVTAETIFAFMGVSGLEDIGLDELAQLKGIATAIKEGSTTVDKAFATDIDTHKQNIVNTFNGDKKPDASAGVTETSPQANGDILQECYKAVTALAEKTGETPDDTLSALTGGKLTCLIDLEAKSANYVKDIMMLVNTEMAK